MHCGFIEKSMYSIYIMYCFVYSERHASKSGNWNIVNIDELPDQSGGAIPKRKPRTETIKTLSSKPKDEMCNSESSDSPISDSSVV